MRAFWLALLTAVIGCRSADKATLRIDATLARFVAPDAVFVAGARMESLRSTPLYRKWVEGKPRPLLDRFAQRTGLDPRRDIGEVLLSSDGKHMVAIARGRFDNQRLEAWLSASGGRRERYKGYTLLGNEKSALLLLDPNTVAGGAPAVLRELADRRNQRRSSPLLEKARAFPATTQFWAISSNPLAIAEELPAGGVLANLRKIAAMLESGTLAGDLHGGLHLTMEGKCRNEEDARTLVEVLRGLVGLARLSTPDNAPELLRAYDRVRVEQRATALAVKAEIPQELLDKLLERWEKGELSLRSLVPSEARPGGK